WDSAADILANLLVLSAGTGLVLPGDELTPGLRFRGFGAKVGGFGFGAVIGGGTLDVRCAGTGFPGFGRSSGSFIAPGGGFGFGMDGFSELVLLVSGEEAAGVGWSESEADLSESEADLSEREVDTSETEADLSGKQADDGESEVDLSICEGEVLSESEIEVGESEREAGAFEKEAVTFEAGEFGIEAAISAESCFSALIDESGEREILS
ncbi:unnamed protein product, partial [Owenia fusiformis]